MEESVAYYLMLVPVSLPVTLFFVFWLWIGYQFFINNWQSTTNIQKRDSNTFEPEKQADLQTSRQADWLICAGFVAKRQYCKWMSELINKMISIYSTQQLSGCFCWTIKVLDSTVCSGSFRLALFGQHEPFKCVCVCLWEGKRKEERVLFWWGLVVVRLILSSVICCWRDCCLVTECIKKNQSKLDIQVFLSWCFQAHTGSVLGGKHTASFLAELFPVNRAHFFG